MPYPTYIDASSLTRSVKTKSSSAAGSNADPDINVTSILDGEDATKGAQADAAATSDTGTFSLVALFKRLLSRFAAQGASCAAATANVNAPAANTAAIVTYSAAGAGISHVIGGVAYSYSVAVSGGNLQITDDGNVIFNTDIVAVGNGTIMFPRGLKGTANKVMVITLAGGGVTAVGKITIIDKRTES